jgi:hypothetical protein
MTFAEFEKDAYVILRGTPKNYQSSPNVVRTFCENCGSPLNYLDSELLDKVEIPIGVFDDPESLVPQEHIWTSRKPSWVLICDDLPRRP